MPKYVEGDSFEATVVIHSVDEDPDYPFVLRIEELDSVVEEPFTQEELDEAFDPNYKERKRLERIRELKEELEELENE
jgi:hypothetical protein